MDSLILATFFVIQFLIGAMIWAIILTAIISWLVAFDIINLRNRAVYQITRLLEAVTRPVLRPFQRVIPTLGGVDVSPIVAIAVLYALNIYLLPGLERFLVRVVP